MQAFKSHIKFLFFLGIFAVSLITNYQHIKNSEDRVVPIRPADVILESDDIETDKYTKLISKRKGHEYLILFARDNPATVRLNSSMNREVDFRFRFLFTGSRGQSCDMSRFEEKPFSFVIRVNGEEFVHTSTPNKGGVARYNISSEDNIEFFFKANANDCGAAKLAIQHAGDYPSYLSFLLILVWALFLADAALAVATCCLPGKQRT